LEVDNCGSIGSCASVIVQLVPVVVQLVPVVVYVKPVPQVFEGKKKLSAVALVQKYIKNIG
jgi:hypothetical protein